jgi:hypothetical protein
MFDLVGDRTFSLQSADRLISFLADNSNSIGQFDVAGMPVSPMHAGVPIFAGPAGLQYYWLT